MVTPAALFLFGKLEGMYQDVKITPLKKITADEQGSSEKTAESLFNAIASFSSAKKISFLVNYHSAQEEEIKGEKKPVLAFHPELIIDGHRLINDFPDVDLNRRFIVLGEWKLQDTRHWLRNSRRKRK